MKRVRCSICNIDIEEHFCPRCGQRFTSKKLSFKSIVSDFVSNFFSMNKSGFATIWSVIAKPQKTVNNYLLGFRNYYSSPGNLILYGIAVISVHLILVDQTSMKFSLGEESLRAQYGFLLAVYPYLMLVSRLSFIRKKINFAEHLISITYCSTSLLILIILLCDIIYLMTGQLFESASFWIFIGLTFFWNSRVFTKDQTTWNVLANTFLQGIIFLTIVGIIVLMNLLLIKP